MANIQLMIGIVKANNDGVNSGEIGGKARGLIFLQKHGFNTPPFFILNHATLMAVSDGSCSLQSLLQDWKTKNNITPDSIWAIRSSADNEDGAKKSFAGLFSTETNVPLYNISIAVEKVIKAYSEIDKLKYNENEQIKFGIIIQEMVRSVYSGVIFSHNPLNIKENKIQINLIPGIGENLVSGKEEAFTVTCRENEISFLNDGDTFKGQIFTDELIEISKTGAEVKTDITLFLTELIQGTQRLVKLKNHPVDVEFTIANNTVYWLQVRPVTAGEECIAIWDNTHAESNYPGLTLPLTISIVKSSFRHAYTSMGIFLGMSKNFISKNEELLKNMCGEIHGALYYNVTAWQQLIFQLPFGKKTSAALPGMWGMEPTDFVPVNYKMPWYLRFRILFKLITSFLFLNKLKKEYILNYEYVVKEYDQLCLEDKNHSELIGIYKDIETRLGRKWAAPLINGFFTMILFSTLKSISIKSRLHKKHPNFVNDILFAQGDVISVTIVREFQKLLSNIRQDKRLLLLFQNEKPETILQMLPVHHKEFYSMVINYISHYGERSDEGELKMETVNYKENPLLFITFLKENSFGKINESRSDIKDFDYINILKQEYPLNIIKRFVLTTLIKKTISGIRDRENLRFIRTKTFGLVRRIFRAIDHNLITNQKIESKNDSLYLTLDELADTANSLAYINNIRLRKEMYKKYAEVKRVNRYKQNNSAYTPVEISTSNFSNAVISGIGCCSGVVKAEVRIIDSKTEVTENFFGKILIADYFEPGKINLFSQAAGIISIRGNLLSHTAILCREMGIPSIVGAKGLMNKIKDGDTIEMNGGTGKINLV